MQRHKEGMHDVPRAINIFRTEDLRGSRHAHTRRDLGEDARPVGAALGKRVIVRRLQQPHGMSVVTDPLEIGMRLCRRTRGTALVHRGYATPPRAAFH